MQILEILIALAPVILTPENQYPHETIVDAMWRMTDTETRYEIALSLLNEGKELDRAYSMFEQLLQEDPKNPKIHFFLGKLDYIAFRYYRAEEHFQNALRLDPNNIEAQVYLAKIDYHFKRYLLAEEKFRGILKKDPEAIIRAESAYYLSQLGYYETAREEFQDLNNDEDINIMRYEAGATINWGDLLQAKRIYYAVLKEHEKPLDIQIDISRMYNNVQRYFESEGVILQQELKSPENEDLRVQWVTTKLLEQDYVGALEASEELEPKNYSLRGQALLKLHLPEEAYYTYEAAEETQLNAFDLNLGKGRALIEMGCVAEAEPYLNQALLLLPESTQAQFYANWDMIFDPCFYESILAYEESGQKLTEWADLYVEIGELWLAILFAERATEVDSDYIPGWFTLGRLYSAAKRYEAAYNIFDCLVELFPGSEGFLIWPARVESYAKHYDSSLYRYNLLLKLDPTHPQAKIEQARVAMWAKMWPEARRYYQGMLSPSVDELMGIEECCALYKYYEHSMCNEEVTEELALLWPLYRIQKQAWLEYKGKFLKRNNRKDEALATFEELLEDYPSNLEIIFDEAQVFCQMGLCDCALNTYSQLLDLNPISVTVQDIVDKEVRLDNWSVAMKYKYWREDGFGEVDQLRRNYVDATVFVPYNCRLKGYFTNAFMSEQPFFNNNIYVSSLQYLGFGGVIDDRFAGRAEVGVKTFKHDAFAQRYMGLLEGSYRYNDYLLFSGGYERLNEIHDLFGLEQGTQSDNLWVKGNSNITYRWNFESGFRWVHYNDNNYLRIAEGTSRFLLFDDPVEVRLNVYFEYRNINQLNQFIYNGANQLIDIIHPYWTPRHYYKSERVELDWLYDYSCEQYCGTDLRFLNFKISVRDDTDHNPGFAVEGIWHHEWDQAYKFELRTAIYRTQQWDAEGVWATFAYQF